jgi:hypothetical protein
MPITPFEFIVCALAVFRLSLLLSKEDGPMWVFRKLRRSVPAKSSAKEGISCPWCVSIWFANLVVLYLCAKTFWLSEAKWFIIAGDSFLLMLALSAGAIIINQQWTKS